MPDYIAIVACPYACGGDMEIELNLVRDQSKIRYIEPVLMTSAEIPNVCDTCLRPYDQKQIRAIKKAADDAWINSMVRQSEIQAENPQ